MMDGKRSTLDSARRLAEKLGRVPHELRNVRDAEANLANAVHEAQQTLASRADLSLEPHEDVSVFTATVDGVRLGAAALLDLLRAERERTATQITAGERELFDKTLTGDTRRHLAERIRAANELVDTMNARLERVRTASRVSPRASMNSFKPTTSLPSRTRTKTSNVPFFEDVLQQLDRLQAGVSSTSGKKILAIGHLESQ